MIRMFLFAVSLSIDLATISRAFPDHALSRFPMAFAAVEPFVFRNNSVSMAWIWHDKAQVDP